MTTTLKNLISCGEFFQWGVRKRTGWEKPQVKKDDKIMENKSTICMDRLAVAGIIPCSPQEQCNQIPCTPQEQCHQIQSTLDKKIALPSNNSFRSLPLPTERSTGSQHRTSHTMCTMQDNKPLNLETFVSPKLSLSLSLREKEEDFQAIKGSKLPLRPKKRLKCIQKAIHDVSPGCWLSDISQGRYEVRENKSTKKRSRSLKATERVGSDLE